MSHTLPPDLLDKLDNTASEMGLTRAGLINLALSEFLKNK
ncbi:MAG: CopG family transcriptional regulator [Bacteroidia bacterium]|nr:MAG: CopG family transcriptional regulator [Bacteroidia bacterium]